MSNAELTNREWQQLTELRQTFLGEVNERKKDYWTTPELLSLYDKTFAQRIGWKWNNVLTELKAKRFVPPVGVIDFGCGTGIAARQWVQHFPSTQEVFLFDRSSSAMEFAKKELLALNPSLTVTTLKEATEIPISRLLLISHVVNELPARQLELLRKLISESKTFVWVEPGTKEVSQLLVQERESLRQTFDLLAPCPHQGACGLLDPKNAAHWCHHFAQPPGQIFRDGFWKKFSDNLKIDLRSLPTSYLVAAKKTSAPPVGNRVIGRARVYKGYAKALVCDATGVFERRILSRHFEETVERLDEGRFCESLDPKEWER